MSTSLRKDILLESDLILFLNNTFFQYETFLLNSFGPRSGQQNVGPALSLKLFDTHM